MVLFLLGKKQLYLRGARNDADDGRCPRQPDCARPLKISADHSAVRPPHTPDGGRSSPRYARRSTRDRFEIVAVLARPVRGAPLSTPHAEALLRRCDAVVRRRCRPADAPTRKSRCCSPATPVPPATCCSSSKGIRARRRMLRDDRRAFSRPSRSRIAWAPRFHRGRTPLGRLIGIHSRHHEKRARRGRRLLAGREQRRHPRSVRATWAASTRPTCVLPNACLASAWSARGSSRSRRSQSHWPRTTTICRRPSWSASASRRAKPSSGTTTGRAWRPVNDRRESGIAIYRGANRGGRVRALPGVPGAGACLRLRDRLSARQRSPLSGFREERGRARTHDSRGTDPPRRERRRHAGGVAANRQVALAHDG